LSSTNGDVALRASRGIVALVWVQLKGLGVSGLCPLDQIGRPMLGPVSPRHWNDQTGIDIAFADLRAV